MNAAVASLSTLVPGMEQAAGLVDKCWSIPVVAAFSGFLFTFIQTNSGVFYVFFIDEMDASREAASWPKSISLAASHLTGVALGAIQHRVPITTMLLGGAILCPVSIIASAFVSNMAWISVTIGLFYGFSLGILQIETSVYMVSYFNEYRSIAMGIKYVGIGMAGVVGPSLLMHFKSVYSFEGTLLLTGGLTLNLIPLILMLRKPQPTNWIVCGLTSTLKPDAKQNTAVSYGTTARPAAHIMLNNAACRDNGGEKLNGAVHMDEQNKIPKDQNMRKFVSAVGSRLCDSSHEPKISSQETNNSSILQQTTQLLRKPCFYFLLVAMVSADFTLPVLSSTIVDYARDKGVPAYDAAEVFTVLCLGRICGHVLIPFISDKIVRTRCSVAAVTFMLLALCFIVMPHAAGFGSVSAVAFVSGVQLGYLLTIKPVLVADYLGADNVALCWGLIGVVDLPFLFGEPTIVGAFRDRGGSYDNFYRTCAAIDILAALLLAAQAGFDTKKKT